MKQKQPLSNSSCCEILRSVLNHNWLVYRRVPLTGKARAHMRTAIRRDIGAVRFFESLVMNAIESRKLASELSDDHLNRKIAAFIGWHFANGKWWHDELGDGPPMNYVSALGRKTAEVVTAAILQK